MHILKGKDVTFGDVPKQNLKMRVKISGVPSVRWITFDKHSKTLCYALLSRANFQHIWRDGDVECSGSKPAVEEKKSLQLVLMVNWYWHVWLIRGSKHLQLAFQAVLGRGYHWSLYQRVVAIRKSANTSGPQTSLPSFSECNMRGKKNSRMNIKRRYASV